MVRASPVLVNFGMMCFLLQSIASFLDLSSVNNKVSFSFFSFQELDLSAEALVFNDSSREQSWLEAIENGLPQSAHYFRVSFKKLAAIRQICYKEFLY